MFLKKIHDITLLAHDTIAAEGEFLYFCYNYKFKNMKKIYYLFLLTLFFSNIILGQDKKINQSNGDYLKELLMNNKIENVFIVSLNKHFDYSQEWLENVKFNGNFVTFTNSKDEMIHTWDISSAIFFEKYRHVLKVRLSESAGH